MASQELRNDTAGVRRRVQAGEEVMVAVNGKPVAQLVALQQTRRRWLPRSELARRLRVAQADPDRLRGLMDPCAPHRWKSVRNEGSRQMPDALSAPSSTTELLGVLPTALLSNSATVESITNYEIYGTRRSATAWRNDPPKD